MSEWRRNQLEQDLWELGVVLAVIVTIAVVGWWLAARPQAAGLWQDGPIGVTPPELVPGPGLDGGGTGGAVTAPEVAIAITSIPRSCTLTVGPIAEMVWPAGYEGASVQITRNGGNHARSDSSAPYGPFTATVDSGTWVLAAKLSKRGLPAISVPLGTTYCGRP